MIRSTHLCRFYHRRVLDLDPNKSLASQIGEENVDEVLGKEENETIASTAPSIDASGTSGLSRTTRDSFPSKADNVDSGTSLMPPNQIFGSKNDDDKSDASSITTFREIQGERNNLDASRILTFLNQIETQLTDQGGVEASENVERSVASRFTDADEVEKRLTELRNKFGMKKSDEAHTDMSTEQIELMKKSQAVFAKLSALLSNRIGLLEDVDANNLSEQSSIENLPTLLTRVLEKLEKSNLDDTTDSSKESDSNLIEKEQEAQPMILCDDPEYAKYFKMLKLGLPRSAVIQALDRDGKDVAILDMDPSRPYTEQKTEVEDQPKVEKNAELKSLFAKRTSVVKDSNKTAALEAMLAKRSAVTHDKDIASPNLRDDPEFQKYMRMLKVGMPKEKVRQALERDGKDQAVADMDPDRPYSSQVSSDDSERPISEDEEYAKFFKVCCICQLCELLPKIV